jgi:Na+/proline symporter
MGQDQALEKIASLSALRAGGIYFIVGSIPVIIGLLGINYIPGLDESEALMPVLAKTHLNYFFYVIFVGALVSAILSTVDTTLLASSAVLSHNLIYPLFPKISERNKLKTARGCTLVVGLISYTIAYSSQSITGLVEIASSLGGPTILVLTMAALWEKRGSSFNAIFAMVMSIMTWILSHFILSIEFPILLTISVCALSYFGTLPFSRQMDVEKRELAHSLSE